MIRIDDSLLPQTSPNNTPVDAPAPSASPATSAVVQPRKNNWLMIIAVGLLAYIVVSGMDCDRSIIPDDDSIVIDEKGKYALVLEDKSEAGQAKLTEGQKVALNSVMTAEAAEDSGFEFRKQDVGDDMSKMEPIWQALRKEASPAPSLTIASDGRVRTGQLPDGVGEVKIALEESK